MKITRVIAIALLAGTFGGSAAVAQSTSSARAPAEFPPASYKGKQYVDSTGCVFIRAGIDGNVTWVPRVTRKRSVVCGFKPTFGGTQVAEAKPAPQKKAPEQITLDEPVKPAAKPAPRKVAKAKPVPKPRKVAKVVKPKPVKRLPAPKPVVKSPTPIVELPAPQQPQARQVARVQPACSGASAVSQRYINNGSKLPVRCGPQAGGVGQYAGQDATPVRRGLFRRAAPEPQQPATPVTVAPGPQPVVVTSRTHTEINRHTRIVPRHVAVNRANTRNVKVPHGYKPAWTDGRLNPKRAEQTLAGRDQMLLKWTSSVPRRLINQATGQDLTASVALVYPYTDYATQERELGQVTIARRADGKLVKRVLKNRSANRALTTTPVYSTRNAPAKPKATTRAAPKKARVAPAPTASSARFVQVGTFYDANAAQRVGKQIRRMGMPVRIGKYSSGGKTVRMVIAGPFDSAGHVDRALNKVKRAGYANAKRRK